MLTSKSRLITTPGLRPIAKTGAAVITAAAVMAGCATKGEDERSAAEPAVEETFHADNDIAMTVRSIADAIRVGEKLDSSDYNFEGILTDGQGAPLYTDITGSPGEWEITVTGDKRARIRNLYLGDLLPEDLRRYVAQALDLDEEDVVESYEFDNDDESELTVYDLGSGTLRFETRSSTAPNGLEGPLVSIILAGK